MFSYIYITTNVDGVNEMKNMSHKPQLTKSLLHFQVMILETGYNTTAICLSE
uniref:Uncharacterized protein n=1 Tax=Arion vulgaris TaxID=1028688 RepID=A0A0B7BSK6_9EUPU